MLNEFFTFICILILIHCVNSQSNCESVLSCSSCVSAAGCGWCQSYGSGGCFNPTSGAFSSFTCNLLYGTNSWADSSAPASQCSALRPIVTCSSYSTCSTCAQVSSCKWIATLSIFNSSGQCLPSTSTYSVITFPYSYSSSGSCPPRPPACSNSSCTACTSSVGCQWIANSGSAGGSGSCVPVNSSSSQFPYVFTIAASCPIAEPTCSNELTCAACTANSGCAWFSTESYAAAGVCLPSTASTPYPYSYLTSNSCPVSTTSCSYAACSTCTTVPACAWYATSASPTAYGVCQLAASPHNTSLYAFSFSVSAPCPSNPSSSNSDPSALLNCSSCTTRNYYWLAYSSLFNDDGKCYATASADLLSGWQWYQTSSQCPTRFLAGSNWQSSSSLTVASSYTDYVPHIAWGVAIVAAVGGFIAFGGLFISLAIRVCHPATKESSPAEANVLLCYRIGVLQVLIGVCGVLSSFAFLSSVLCLAGGAVAVSNMTDLTFARDVVRGRKTACSHPVNAGNLAIATIVFATLDLGVNLFFYFVLVPYLVMFDSWCAGTGSLGTLVLFSSGSYSTCSVYAQPFAVIAIYICDGLTMSALCFILSVAYIAVYCQAMNSLGSGAVVCGCGRRDHSSEAEDASVGRVVYQQQPGPVLQPLARGAQPSMKMLEPYKYNTGNPLALSGAGVANGRQLAFRLSPPEPQRDAVASFPPARYASQR